MSDCRINQNDLDRLDEILRAVRGRPIETVTGTLSKLDIPFALELVQYAREQSRLVALPELRDAYRRKDVEIDELKEQISGFRSERTLLIDIIRQLRTEPVDLPVVNFSIKNSGIREIQELIRS